MEKKKKKDKEESTFWKLVTSTGGKIGAIVGLIVGLQFLVPFIQDFFVGDQIKTHDQEIRNYVDEELDRRFGEKEDEGQMWLEIFLGEFNRIDDRYERDSLAYANNHRTFAIGLRADMNGIVSYRSRHKKECSVRINHSTGNIEFYRERKQKWLPILFEDM